jgi:predicted amidohydrolase
LKVAAYQAPLLPSGSTYEGLTLIRDRVSWCESEGIDILCCPEAILGGLADYAPQPRNVAISVQNGELAAVLAPLASQTVTTIVGFTELAGEALYNSAAILHRGDIAGVYRKRHPAIRRSIYRAGTESPVFTIGGLTFGILICNDSNFAEDGTALASQGATALFVPSNNGLPPEKADVIADARKIDVRLATEHRVFVIRADVAGRADGRVSYGSTAITGPDGAVRGAAVRLAEDLVVGDLSFAQRGASTGA